MKITKLPSSKTRDIFILFCIVFIVLLFRRHDAFTNPQLWAEDCIIFFKQSEELGIRSLFIPYSGYLLVLPRLFGIFYSAISISYFYIPAFYDYTGFAVTFLVAWGMYESAVYLNLKHKLVYATWFLFMPVGPDLFMELGSVGWMTGLYLLNYIFVGNPIKNEKLYYLHLFILLLISLTHPFSALYAPMVVLILIIERKGLTIKKAFPYLIILFGGIIQGIYIAFIDTGVYRGVPGLPAEQYHVLRLFTNNVREIFFFMTGLLPDITNAYQIEMCICIFIMFIIIFCILYKQVTAKRKYVLIGAGLICFASFIKTYWPNESYVLALDNSRYYFVPFTAMGWILIIALDKKLTSFHIITYLAFFMLHSHHLMSKVPDKQWKKQLKEFYENKRDVIDINPEGWKYVPDRNKMRKP